MLAHILAVTVGLGSVALYLAAFFFPEIHRKHDFFWSGVGWFYALVLWVSAGQVSTTEFLGHLSCIALVSWFGWQTLTLRRKRTPRDLQTPLNHQSWQLFGQDMAGLGTAWLRRTPLGRFISGTSPEKVSPSLTGEFRASSLKQVDYEFLDELLPEQGMPQNDKDLRSAVSSPQQAIFPQQSSLQRVTAKPAVTKMSRDDSSTQALRNRPKQTKRSLTPLEMGAVIKDWLVEVVKAVIKPNPQKPVIDIPPRDAGRSPSKSVAPSTQTPAIAETEQEPIEQTHSDNSMSDNPMQGDPVLGKKALSGKEGKAQTGDVVVKLDDTDVMGE